MNIKTLLIIYLLLMGSHNLIYSQNKSINVETNWNGKMCNGGHGMCYIDNSINKTPNTQVSFNKESNELI